MRHSFAELGRKGGKATRGARKGTAKLTEPQVRHILSSSEPSRVLAEAFHVSQSQIAAIRRRQWWFHVKP